MSNASAHPLTRWRAALRALLVHPEAHEFYRNTVWALLAYGIGIGIEKLILMPYLGRRLSEAAFGVLLLGRNTTTVLASGLFAGLHNLLLRRNQEWSEGEKAVAVRSAAWLGGALLGVEFVLVLIVLWWRGQLATAHGQMPALVAFAVWGFANVINNLWQTYWRMQFRLPFFYSLQVFNGLALLLIIPFYRWGGETGMYWGWAAAGLVPWLATASAAHFDRTWRSGGVYWERAEARRMLREMWVFVWGVIGQALLQNLDRFIIGGLLGAAAVSAYFKVTNTAYMIVVPVEPLSGVLLSMIAQERLGAHTLVQLRRLHIFMFVLVTGVVGLGILLGQPVTDLLYGAGTFAARPELYWIVLAGCACALVSILLRGMLIVYVPARWIVWHDTLSVVFLAGASAVLTWLYGLTGAAVAVALALAFRALFSEAVVWRAVRRELQAMRSASE